MRDDGRRLETANHPQYKDSTRVESSAVGGGCHRSRSVTCAATRSPKAKSGIATMCRQRLFAKSARKQYSPQLDWLGDGHAASLLRSNTSQRSSNRAAARVDRQADVEGGI